jgi:hypothetical protein
VAKVPRNLLPSAVNRVVAGLAQPAKSKIGPVAGITERNIAKPSTVVSEAPGLGDNRTQVDTYFTTGPRPGEQLPQIYTGDRFWARVTLTLETAGPVSIGNSTKLLPVLGGGGRLLVTNQPVTITVAKGTRLYVASTGVNRIGRVVEPLPWLEQITGILGSALSNIAALATGKRG